LVVKFSVNVPSVRLALSSARTSAPARGEPSSTRSNGRHSVFQSPFFVSVRPESLTSPERPLFFVRRLVLPEPSLSMTRVMFTVSEPDIWLPLLLCVQSMLLAIFAILFFVGIFFLVDSFCGYAVSSAPKKVSDAEENKAQEDEELANNSSAELVPDVMLHVEEAVDRWIARGGYRESGINLPAAAEAIGVPRYLLSAWLKTDEQRTYSSWMTALRIEEAQRVIKAHPDWNNETIAAHCGFADRSYFQRKFKELTGITPAQYTQQV